MGGERTPPAATPGRPDSTAGFRPLLRGQFPARPGPAESGPRRVGPAAFTLPGPSGVPASLAREPRLLGRPECPLVLQLSCLQALPWRNVTGKPFPAMGHAALMARSQAAGREGEDGACRCRAGPWVPAPGPAAVPYLCSGSGLTETAGPTRHLATYLRLSCRARPARPRRDPTSRWAEAAASSPSEVSPVHLSCGRTVGARAAPGGPE